MAGREARGIASLLLWAASGVMGACGSPDDGWKGPLPAQCRGLSRGPTAEVHDEEDGLPVFNLFLAESLPDDDGYSKARLVYRGRCHALQMKYRGDTSHFFPKRSYTLEFPDKEPFSEPVLGEGFTGRHKVVLVSPFNDNSYLRHRLAFALWNRMSPDHIQVKTYSAVVYVNEEYLGLYTVVDHIDKHLVAAQGLDKGGELFKASGDDANFSNLDVEGEPKIDMYQGFEKKAGLPEDGPGAYDSIGALTAFVAESSPEEFQSQWGSWMDTRDYEDWWILASLAVTNDSVSKNAFHYRARGAGARWRFIPWDLDASLGQDWDTRRNDPMARVDPLLFKKNYLFTRMLSDPAIAQPLRERFLALLKEELHPEVVLGLIEQYSREIAPAAHRDEARWTGDYRIFFRWDSRTDFTTHDEEVEYLRQWVRTRWGALEQQLH